MTLYEFNGLDEMEQLEVIWESTEVATRKDNEWNVKLLVRETFILKYGILRTVQ